MYAAAGGASLASRQARLKQKRLDQVKQSKTQSSEISLPKTKGFHSLPPSYYEQHDSQRPDYQQHGHKCPKYASNLKISQMHTLKPNYERRHSTISTLPKSLDKIQYKIRSSHSVFDIQKNLIDEFTTEKNNLIDFNDDFLKLSHQNQNDSVSNEPKNIDVIVDSHDPIYPQLQPVPNPDPVACYYDHFDYPFSECSQGRTAWIEKRERDGFDASAIRQSDAQKLWQRRYKIRDLSTAKILENENFHQSAAANTLLYVGLGATAIGLVVAFVGNSEKGFKTYQLRLIGPCMMVFGLICVFIRIMSCFCTLDCILCRNRPPQRNQDKYDYLQMEELLSQQRRSHKSDVKLAKNNGIADNLHQERRIAISRNMANQETSSSDDFYNSDVSTVHQNGDVNGNCNLFDSKSDYNSHTGILLTPLELPLH